MVESGNATLHVTGRRCLFFGLDSQVPEHVDPLTGRYVLKANPSAADGMDLTDGGTIELGNRPARTTEEDVGDSVELIVVRSIIDVENDLPWCARLHSVVVADRQHRPKVRKIDVVRMSFMNVP
jgi:hypothetical protein